MSDAGEFEIFFITTDISIDTELIEENESEEIRIIGIGGTELHPKALEKDNRQIECRIWRGDTLPPTALINDEGIYFLTIVICLESERFDRLRNKLLMSNKDEDNLSIAIFAKTEVSGSLKIIKSKYEITRFCISVVRRMPLYIADSVQSEISDE